MLPASLRVEDPRDFRDPEDLSFGHTVQAIGARIQSSKKNGTQSSIARRRSVSDNQSAEKIMSSRFIRQHVRLKRTGCWRPVSLAEFLRESAQSFSTRDFVETTEKFRSFR